MSSKYLIKASSNEIRRSFLDRFRALNLSSRRKIPHQKSKIGKQSQLEIRERAIWISEQAITDVSEQGDFHPVCTMCLFSSFQSTEGFRRDKKRQVKHSKSGKYMSEQGQAGGLNWELSSRTQNPVVSKRYPPAKEKSSLVGNRLAAC